jgi:hypothetical protein
MLVKINCISCGAEFGILESIYKQRCEDGKTFFCPQGHGMVIAESEVEKLQKQVDQWKNLANRRLDRVRELEAANTLLKRRINGYKGQLKRRKNQDDRTS